jgi:ABC-2 type transport system permease protein
MSAPVSAPDLPPSGFRKPPGPGFADLLRMEWVKARTVPAARWCLLGLAAPVLGVAAMTGAEDRPDTMPIAWVVGIPHHGFLTGQIAVIVFAVAAIGSEYSTGLIHTSLAAVPWRRRWLVAKALVVAGLVLVAGALLSGAAFTVVYLATPDVSGPVLHPTVIRAVAGSGLYLSGLAVLSLAVGALVRSTAGGLVLMLAATFIVPNVVAMTSLERVTPFLPAGNLPPGAGAAITQLEAMQGGLSPWAGFAVLCAWAVAALAGAAHMLHVRDA